MAVTFRAIASTAYSGKTNTTVSKPTGTVNDDIMIATLMAGTSVSQAAALAVTPPAGWTQIGTAVAQTQGGGGFHGAFFVYWRRAASEGTSYDFTHSTLTTQATITSYSGCIATGSPVDLFSQNNGLTTTSTGTGVTTTVAATKLVYAAHNWTGSTTLTPPSGMTERFDGICYIADEDRASAGATSNRTQTIPDAVWQVYMIALKPPASGAFTLSAVAGSYAMTGTAATLTYTGVGPPTFRAEAHTTYGQVANLTNVAKPTGTIDNDIMLAGVLATLSTATPTDINITAPAGWTQIDTNTQQTAGGYYAKLFAYWKRASSEGASYDFTHSGTNTTATTQIVIASYSGCIATGSPIDVSSTSQGLGTAATYSSVTTTGANDKLVLLGHNWVGAGTITPPTGMTERFDGVAYAADETIVGTGATGTRSHTVNSSADPWGGFLVALKRAGAAAYTLTAAAGSYAFTGTAATPKHAWKPTAALGSYGLTGTAATPTKLVPKSLAAAAGGYAMTGGDAVTRHTWKPVADPGSYGMLGTAAGTVYQTGGIPVFRALASTSYAQRTTLTNVAKPTGTVDGDVMVATFFAANSVLLDIKLDGIPAGWTQIGTTVDVTQQFGGFSGRMWVFWKRALSEGASYDFLHNNQLSTQAIIASYSGCVTTGTPINNYSQNAGTDLTTGIASAFSITTTSASTKLLYLQHNWDNTQTLTPPTGMTERFDGIVYHADEDRAAAGSTGNRIQTLAGTGPWQAYLVALSSLRQTTPFAPPPVNPAIFLPFLVR